MTIELFENMKNILVILIIVLASCKPTEKSVIGTYIRYRDFENRTSIQLKLDKTFIFKAQEGCCVFFETTGIWSLNENKLFLDSFKDSIADNKSVKSIIQKENTTNKYSTTIIKVFDDENYPLPGTSIIGFNGKDTTIKKVTDIEGICVLPNQFYDSIQISYIIYSPITYIGRNSYIEVKMGMSYPKKFIIDKETWLLTRNILLDPRFKYDYKRNKYIKKKNYR